ncbi:MAG: FtsX-like permease family protein [Acidimicrobiia bacterium]|nr:FtsX-like permease family protein [Acidimicrobiia bacterium]
MLRAAFKNIWAHKIRSGLLSLAILAGVSFVVAAFVFTDTIGEAFDDLFSEAFAATDIQVRREVDPDLSFGLPERMPEDLIEQVKNIPGVEGAWGTVLSPYGQILDAQGDLLPTAGPPTFVTSWSGGPSQFTIRDGRPPVGASELMLDVGTIERAGFAVGDTVEMLIGGPKLSFTLVGSLGFGEADNLLGTSWALFDLETAQQLLDATGQVDAIEITIEPAGDLDTVIEAVDAVLPSGIEAVSSQSVAEEQTSQVKEGLGFLNTLLLAFAGISLFVGVFVIYNAFRIVVAQRTRELGLLRAIGATRGQVTSSVLFESAVTGLIASLFGVGAGVLLAMVMQVLIEVAFGGDLPSGGLQLQVRTVVVALVTGLTVTMISALLPAIRASRISPMAALRDVPTVGTRKSWRNRVIGGTPIALLGTAAIAGGLTGLDVADLSPALLVGIGAGLVFIGTYVLSPLVARPVARLIGVPMRALSNATGNLAQRNAARSPRRTAATAGALMIGLALVATVSILAASTRDTATSAIEEAFTADLLLQPPGFGFIGFSSEAISAVATLDGVDLITGVQAGPAKVLGSTTLIAGVDPTVVGEFLSVETVDGSFEGLGGNLIATTQSVADDKGLELGDPIDVGFARTGAQEFELAAIIDIASATDVSWFMATTTFSANYIEDTITQAYVRLAEGVSIESGRTAIEAALEPFPGIQVIDQEELRDQISSQINQVVYLIFGLLAMSVFIALLGILLTLLLSVYERTHEIGLLRAIGMSRPQVRNMIGLESVIIAIFGALLGAGLGMAFGWALVAALADQGLELSIPWGWLATGIVGAAVAGILAAAWPAFRASNLDVLEAISYE